MIKEKESLLIERIDELNVNFNEKIKQARVITNYLMDENNMQYLDEESLKSISDSMLELIGSMTDDYGELIDIYTDTFDKED